MKKKGMWITLKKCEDNLHKNQIDKNVNKGICKFSHNHLLRRTIIINFVLTRHNKASITLLLTSDCTKRQ